jgi:two-component system, cell cycle response regulator
MKVLVADDDACMRYLICQVVRDWGYEPVEAENGAQALEHLQGPDSPKLAVLDWMMPELDGIEVCRQIRSANQSYIYMLLLTARQSNDDLLHGLDAGADDYLAKPVDIPQLKARLAAGRRIIELQQKLIEAYEAKRIEAAHDSLTGMLNRAAILQFLEGEHARSRRENTAVAVITADVDRFKMINDQHGHSGGDEVLRQVAHRLSHSLRKCEWIGRCGGEEFLIVLPDCDLTAAAAVAERLRVCICDTPAMWNDAQINLSISLGVAAGQDQECRGEALVQAADQALYKAKNAGRNRVEVALEMSPLRVATLLEEDPCGCS